MNNLRTLPRWFASLAVLLAVAAPAFAQTPKPETVQPPPPILCTGFKLDDAVSRIAFGSCCHQNRPQPIWHTIADAKPDLFIFLGDNIYGDSEDMNVLREKYARLQQQPGLRRLIDQGCGVFATWDDHDYGKNDAGEEFPMKAESKQVFLDAFGEPTDSPRRAREGIYDARIIGPPGRRVQIILLDTRTFRSPLVRRDDDDRPGSVNPGPYQRVTDPTSTILGPQQWAWLEEQLKAPAEFRIIASSIQFVADGHNWEKWGHFPHERARMVELIRSTHAQGVVFLSGDRHSAEITRWINPESGSAIAIQPPYPLYDVTSSALNQPRRFANEQGAHRIGAMYFEPNFGFIEIDWSRDDPVISLQIRDENGEIVIRSDATFSALRPR